eukprot:11936304-Ditylum_brightwellii.AAC.1
MMPIVTLSVTEAELFAVVLCAQVMMCAMKILNSMGLQVELPMIVYLDNKGAKDFVNNWSIGGHTRHVEVKQYFLRELKEDGIIECCWKKGQEMTLDIFTKNCACPLFDKHVMKFVGKDEYVTHDNHKGILFEAEN